MIWTTRHRPGGSWLLAPHGRLEVSPTSALPTQHIGNEELTPMHHHRKMLITGRIIATLALVLLARLAFYAFGSEHPPISARFVFMTAVALLLGATAIRLLGDASAVDRIERRTSSHVEGVRQTVDRLAAALPKESPGRR
ncbi:hypothetical protein [Micromonospora sp. NPDC048839]|uniref:hypothetical protein n=1 Tax=Micromonospora sp. NPDC048839 TaxID=3155641 RepID=UPI0033E7AEC7